MQKKYVVTLTDEERQTLGMMISRGKAAARKLTRARILLKADQSPGGPGLEDTTIGEQGQAGRATVERVRKRFVEEGFEAALEPHKPRRTYLRKLDGDGEAHLIALACGEPPDGRSRWTLRLLANRMVRLEYGDELSKDTVARVLKKTNSSRG
ncbi:MAG: helix-turn-helix domain-containing protein [Phycisphaeraceae bacterium]